jgi:hypothetical protein
VVGSEWSASRPCRFTPVLHSRASLGDVEERKFLTLPELEPRHLGSPAHSQSLYPLRCLRFSAEVTVFCDIAKKGMHNVKPCMHIARTPREAAKRHLPRIRRQACEAARTADHAEALHFSLSILNRTRAAVQSDPATRSEARLSTSKNRLALARLAAASIRG